MKFLTLADRSGMVETELFADAYRRWGAVTAQHPVVAVSGKAEPFANGNGFTLRVDRVEKPRVRLSEKMRMNVHAPATTSSES
jgi:DNA polymerase III alpha subunit